MKNSDIKQIKKVRKILAISKKQIRYAISLIKTEVLSPEPINLRKRLCKILLDDISTLVFFTKSLYEFIKSFTAHYKVIDLKNCLSIARSFKKAIKNIFCHMNKVVHSRYISKLR